MLSLNVFSWLNVLSLTYGFIVNIEKWSCFSLSVVCVLTLSFKSTVKLPYSLTKSWRAFHYHNKKSRSVIYIVCVYKSLNMLKLEIHFHNLSKYNSFILLYFIHEGTFFQTMIIKDHLSRVRVIRTQCWHHLLFCHSVRPFFFHGFLLPMAFMCNHLLLQGAHLSSDVGDKLCVVIK